MCDPGTAITVALAVGSTATSLYGAQQQKKAMAYQQQMEQQKLAEMKARNDARDKAIREKKPGFGSLPPLSPESIARARQEWGISS